MKAVPFRVWQVLALTVGTLLVVLVFVGVPLKYWGDSDSVASVVGVTHGFLFMVYLVVTYDVGRRRGWSMQRLFVTALAGIVPVLTFVVEHRARVEERALQPVS